MTLPTAETGEAARIAATSTTSSSAPRIQMSLPLPPNVKDLRGREFGRRSRAFAGIGTATPTAANGLIRSYGRPLG